MGAVGCIQTEEMRDDEVTSELTKARLMSQKVHKLLLLGPGGSGKSTFMRHLSNIHGNELNERERVDGYRSHIYASVLDQFRHLILMATEDFGVEFKDETLLETQKKVLALNQGAQLTEEIANYLQLLWNQPEMKLTFEKRNNLGVADSAAYFWDDLERVAHPDYVPTFEDILLARMPTCGITELKFEDSGHLFTMVDVGGQRNERQKWIHCFEQVHGLIFVVSASSYCQKLHEDHDVNGLAEGLEIWANVCQSPYFDNQRTSIVLFFNKSDLFYEKIKMEDKPFTMAFPEYEGDPHDAEECLAYMKKIFLAANPIPQKKRQVYTHVTCATDRQNVSRVFTDVQHNIVLNAMVDHGIL